MEKSGKTRNSSSRKDLTMHSFLLRQHCQQLAVVLTVNVWYMKMFFTLTCKERGEGVCSDFLWVKSATFWWKDWKIMSVLLNHSSSVVKVGVLAPQTLEPAVCKQLNKVIVAMIEVMAFWGFVLSLLQLLKQLKLGRTAVTVSVQQLTCLY